MKQAKIYGIFASLIIATALQAGDCVVPCSGRSTSYYSLRSQGINAARDLVGIQQFINNCTPEHLYGFITTTIELDQSFRPKDIAQTLFGNDLCCNLKSQPAFINITGSMATDRQPHDWLADYFGLPSDFRSTIFFKPTIQNIIADISFYVGINQCNASGLYLRINMPLVHTKWKLNFCECVDNPGTQALLPGSFLAQTCSSALSRSLLFPDATAFFCGEKIDEIQPLAASKWFCGCDTPRPNKTLASLNADLGWNFICCDDYHFGIKIRACAPTGDRPNGEYLFEQIVGNGHHWEIGGGISAHSTLWRGCNDQTVAAYLEANITHLCNTCQVRSFDLCGKPNSRYMLAQRLGPNLENLSGCTTTTLCPNPTLSNNQMVVDLNLNGDFAPVANITKSKVNVGVAAQGDIVVKFAYTSPCGFEWDIGYNLWARSCENISRLSCNRSKLADGNTWALKGDAVVFGIAPDLITFHQLAATQHCATIHAGTNGFVAGNEATPENQLALNNPGIDNPEFAFIGQGIGTLALTSPVTGDPIRTSIQPIFLTEDDVDLRGTRALSNKIFTHINYTWPTTQQWNAFIGFGAAVEFGSTNNSCTKPCCSSRNSNTVAISQWSLWIKGGLSFDVLSSSAS